MSNCSKFSNDFFFATELTSFPASSNEAIDTDAGNLVVTEKLPQVASGLLDAFPFLTGADSAPVVQCNESLSNNSS